MNRKTMPTLTPLPVNNSNPNVVTFKSTNAADLWRYNEPAPMFDGVNKKTESKYKKYTRFVKQIEHDHPITCMKMDSYKQALNILDGLIRNMLDEMNKLRK